MYFIIWKDFIFDEFRKFLIINYFLRRNLVLDRRSCLCFAQWRRGLPIARLRIFLFSFLQLRIAAVKFVFLHLTNLYLPSSLLRINLLNMIRYVFYFLLIDFILKYPLTISSGGQYVPHELSDGLEADRAYILVFVGNFSNIDPLSHVSK
jgi:hypothetical protein